MKPQRFIPQSECLNNWETRGDCSCRRCLAYDQSSDVIWGKKLVMACEDWVDFIQAQTGHKRRLALIHVSYFIDGGLLVETDEGSGVLEMCKQKKSLGSGAQEGLIQKSQEVDYDTVS